MGVQINPKDAKVLDFEGKAGAIGRIETSSATSNSITLDLKGYQYQGRIQAGPTAMVVSTTNSAPGTTSSSKQLKVDSVTDEYISLQETSNVLKTLDGVIKGNKD